MPLDLGTRELKILWETYLKNPKVQLSAGADAQQCLNSGFLGIKRVVVCSDLTKVRANELPGELSV